MDEEQISTLRAALHNWIDHASVEQLERINQVRAIDVWHFAPEEMEPVEPPVPQGDSTPYPSQRNIDNERRREHAAWRAERGRRISMNATPEQMAEWEAENPEPSLRCPVCGEQISRNYSYCPMCGRETRM
jgi:rubrerythrin